MRVAESIPASPWTAKLERKALKNAALLADACRNVPELTVKQSHRPGDDERRRRAEARQRHRGDVRARRLTAGGEIAYLREQLRLGARLTARLAAKSDIQEMAQLVVDELHETFDFYLAAVQRLDSDGVLRLLAARGLLGEVMKEFLLTEQPVSEGVNGRVARSSVTALVTDTRTDRDYIVRDPRTDPARSSQSPSSWTARCGAC